MFLYAAIIIDKIRSSIEKNGFLRAIVKFIKKIWRYWLIGLILMLTGTFIVCVIGWGALAFIQLFKQGVGGIIICIIILGIFLGWMIDNDELNSGERR